MVYIEGQGIILRDFEEDDFPGIRTWVNNKEVTSLLLDADIFSSYHSEEMTRGFLNSSINKDNSDLIRMVMAAQEDNQYLGQLEIYHIDRQKSSCSFDLLLKSPDLFDRGIGTESVSLLVEYIFQILKIREISIWVLEENHRALGCFQKCGFQVDRGQSIKKRINERVYTVLNLKKSHTS